jgi:hypothetical protein
MSALALAFTAKTNKEAKILIGDALMITVGGVFLNANPYFLPRKGSP